jgi:hypothetical protein
MEQDWLDGFITHTASGATPEPATRVLKCWHQVFNSTRRRLCVNVTFLD